MRSRWKTAGKLLGHCVTGAAIGAIGWFVVWAWRHGLLTDPDAMAAFVEGYGPAAPLLFLLVQVGQILLAFVPGGASCTVGVLLFGPWMGFVYNFTGIFLGSLLNFCLARRFGTRFVQLFGGEEKLEKHLRRLEEKDRFVKWFFAAILLPFFPDDFLCMLAGLTHMSLRQFCLILLLGKPLTVAMYSVGLAQLLQLAVQNLAG